MKKAGDVTFCWSIHPVFASGKPEPLTAVYGRRSTNETDAKNEVREFTPSAEKRFPSRTKLAMAFRDLAEAAKLEPLFDEFKIVDVMFFDGTSAQRSALAAGWALKKVDYRIKRVLTRGIMIRDTSLAHSLFPSRITSSVS
jgi:hypothetical protein